MTGRYMGVRIIYQYMLISWLLISSTKVKVSNKTCCFNNLSYSGSLSFLLLPVFYCH